MSCTGISVVADQPLDCCAPQVGLLARADSLFWESEPTGAPGLDLYEDQSRLGIQGDDVQLAEPASPIPGQDSPVSFSQPLAGVIFAQSSQLSAVYATDSDLSFNICQLRVNGLIVACAQPCSPRSRGFWIVGGPCGIGESDYGLCDRWVCEHSVGIGSVILIVENSAEIGWSSQCLCVHVSRRPLEGSRRPVEPGMWSNEPAHARKWMNGWIDDADAVSIALISASGRGG